MCYTSNLTVSLRDSFRLILLIVELRRPLCARMYGSNLVFKGTTEPRAEATDPLVYLFWMANIDMKFSSFSPHDDDDETAEILS